MHQQATPENAVPTRYQQYKEKLSEIERSGQAVKDVPGVRTTIEQDKLLTQMEIQTLLQSPMLRLAAPEESNKANAQADESGVFL
ncbi:hypothetical protein D3C77_505860 [compost metagenome]